MIPKTLDVPQIVPRAIEHMTANCERDLPWFTGGPRHNGEMVIVGGGPSLLPRIDVLGRRQKEGATVLATNGTNILLRERGIEPDMVVFVDPSPAVAGFIDHEEPSSSLYLIASICDPNVFDELDGREVFMWHPELAGQTKQQAAIFERYPDKPCSLIGGGNTGAMRALNIGFLLGYRIFHLYGMDSSYPRGGADHAYTKHDGPESEAMSVIFEGKPYCASPWMIRQADEFKFYYAQLTTLGCKIHVHGDGLIPDIAKTLKRLVRESRHATAAVH